MLSSQFLLKTRGNTTPNCVAHGERGGGGTFILVEVVVFIYVAVFKYQVTLISKYFYTLRRPSMLK